MKPKYSVPDSAVTCTSLPTVNRNDNAWVTTRYARTAPVTNNAAPEATNPTA